jgi:CRISPR-associated endonuclease/helicase Cas3
MVHDEIEFFDRAFRALTSNAPFPWQRELYKLMVAGTTPPVCDIPTGLGKTAVIAIWLIALANWAKSKGETAIPRRLVYVVNRRTVVDQSTRETETIRKRLNGEGDLSAEDRAVVAELKGILEGLSSREHEQVLSISTLRGQFADNGEWRSDPARPAVVVGTVDMIGSRLLFSGYGCGFKSRPLHAGFLGQDALIVHDEAHLEPAFQELLVAIQREQKQGRAPDYCPLHVMALSATCRDGGNGKAHTLSLSSEDLASRFVQERISAKKAIAFPPTPLDDEKKTADTVAGLALAHKDSNQSILVFVRKVDDVEKVAELLRKGKVAIGQIERLTGTLRGKERDELVTTPVFRRFLPGAAE